MTLLIHPPIDEQRLKLIQDAAGSLPVINAATPEESLIAAPKATAFYGKITPELLARMERLEWVQSPTASLEHYVFPELAAHQCTLTNMRGLFSDVIADHVMAYVLCFARNFHIYLRQREWSPVGDTRAITDFVNTPGTVTPVDRSHKHVSDQSLGVVGVGAIGAEVLKRASAFGMALYGVDPHPRELTAPNVSIWPMDRLEELLASSDYLVIAAPHTPETEGMFQRPLIRKMKRSGILINIGRGAIVDLNDLTESLVAEEIAGAALDVAEEEPLPAAHPLWKLTNVIITPHVAAASPRIAERHTAMLVENVRRFAHGESLLNVVADKQQWY